MGVTQKSVGSMALPIGHLLMDIVAAGVGRKDTMGILPTVNPTYTHTTTGAITSKGITEGIIADMVCGLVALLSFDSRVSMF